jgi:hypothetical protein
MSEDNSAKKSNAYSSFGNAVVSRRHLLGSTSFIAASVVASTALPRTATAESSPILPTPEPPFKGHIERTLKGLDAGLSERH